MTPQEARIDLERFVRSKTTMVPAFLDIALEALGKQNPMHTDHDEYGDPVCRRCGKPVTFDLETNAYEEWCSACGQHLEVGE